MFPVVDNGCGYSDGVTKRSGLAAALFAAVSAHCHASIKEMRIDLPITGTSLRETLLDLAGGAGVEGVEERPGAGEEVATGHAVTAVADEAAQDMADKIGVKLGKPEAPHTQADRAKGSEKDSAKP